MNDPVLRPKKEDRPRTSMRLPQLNKSNRLLRRRHVGRTIPLPAVARPVWTPLED